MLFISSSCELRRSSEMVPPLETRAYRANLHKASSMKYVCRLLGRVEHRLLIFRCRYKTHTLHIPVFLFYCVYLFARMDGRRPGRKTVGTESFYFPHVTFENAFRTGSSGSKCEVLTTCRTFFPAASCRISVA